MFSIEVEGSDITKQVREEKFPSLLCLCMSFGILMKFFHNDISCSSQFAYIQLAFLCKHRAQTVVNPNKINQLKISYSMSNRFYACLH